LRWWSPAAWATSGARRRAGHRLVQLDRPPQFGDSFNAVRDRHQLPSYNYLIFGAILVLMMLFRREGFPETRTRQVLQEAERSDDEELDGGEV
jgi:hypothetical protein